jgi:hypothetical protein
MRRVRLLGTLLAGTLACSSLGSPEIETSWRDPSVSDLHFRRVLISYVSNDESVRRRVEDNLVKQIPNSFAAHRVAPDLNVRDRSSASALLRDKMFDGALVMRVVDAQDRQTYVPLTTWYTGYPSFYGYLGSSWGMVQRPGYLVTDRIVSVETTIYSIKEDKLLWAARTRALNANSSSKLVDETVDLVVRELRGQRLMQ